MLTQRLANIVFAIVVIIACIWFALIAQDFKATGLLASSGLPSKFFPHLTLGVTALCAIIVFFLYTARGSAGGDEGETVYGTSGDARRGLLVLVVAVVSYLIWMFVGFIPMAILLGPLCLLAMGIRSIWIYITVLIMTALIYVIFTQLLGVQFS